MPRRKSDRDQAITDRVTASRALPRPTVDEVRQLVEQAEAAGQGTLRIVVTKAMSSRSNTFQLCGPGSPKSLSEPSPRHEAGYNYVAHWAVCDVKVWLRSLDHRCFAPGCSEPCTLKTMLCTRHWKALGGHTRIRLKQAYARANVRSMNAAHDTRAWLTAAVDALAEAAAADGLWSAGEREALASMASGWLGRAGITDPYAMLGAFLDDARQLGIIPC